MRYKFFVLFLSFCNWALGLSAQSSVVVSGSYTMVLERNRTIEETEKICIEQAKLDALEKEFGTTVSEAIINQTTEVNGKVDNTFNVLTRTNVSGEWLEDEHQPELIWECVGATLQLTAKVKGIARAFPKTGKVEIVFYTCTTSDATREEINFKNGEGINAVFKAAKDGMIAVYYIDHTAQTVYRLLPTGNGKNLNGLEVNADQTYVLFNRKKAIEYGWGNMSTEVELEVPSGKTVAMDELVLVYSSEPLNKPSFNESKDGLSQMALEKFEIWLSKTVNSNEKAQVKRSTVTIAK
jgi:hypothetical protein